MANFSGIFPPSRSTNPSEVGVHFFDIVRLGNSSKEIDAQLSKVDEDGEEKLRVRNFDVRNERLETGTVVMSRRR